MRCSTQLCQRADVQLRALIGRAMLEPLGVVRCFFSFADAIAKRVAIQCVIESAIRTQPREAFDFQHCELGPQLARKPEKARSTAKVMRGFRSRADTASGDVIHRGTLQ
jgi:hypothetical protein